MMLRAISVLPPPLLDEEDPASRVTRYRMLTRDSGRWVGPAANQFNTGRFAMGGGIYVDNRNAREDTSVAVSGGKTLRSRWLNPEGGEADNWHGPYYLSPGWLKIDPTFDPLRNNPRFKRLVAGSG